MAWWRWGHRALSCGGGCGETQWLAPPVHSPVAFQSINDHRFSQLRRQAVQFVEATTGLPVRRAASRCRVPGSLPRHTRAVAGEAPATSAVAGLTGREAAGAAVVRLRALLQWQLEPLDYLEQVLAGVPEPVLLDRVLRILAGDVPYGARCGVP